MATGTAQKIQLIQAASAAQALAASRAGAYWPAASHLQRQMLKNFYLFVLHQAPGSRGLLKWILSLPTLPVSHFFLEPYLFSQSSENLHTGSVANDEIWDKSFHFLNLRLQSRRQ